MKNILGYAGRTLTWVEPGLFKMNYELRSGDDLVGTLQMKGAFSPLATGTCGEGTWTFERRGVFRHRVEVRPSGDSDTMFEFRRTSWKGGGAIVLKDGKTMCLARHIWSSRFEWTTETGEPFVEHTMRGFFRRECDVEIRHKASYIPETPWLVLLAWYIAVMGRRDAARHAG